MLTVRGDRRFGTHSFYVTTAVGLAEMRVDAGMIVRMTAPGKREGNTRRQHAKHIGQGEQPPGPPSLGSCQTHEHPVVYRAITKLMANGSLLGNTFSAKHEYI